MRVVSEKILKGGETMKRISALVLVLVFFSFSFSGCYYFSAKEQMKTAERLLSELKSQGGDKLVTYEYCSAEKFLEISKMEFDENDYKHSRDFANRSITAAQAGLAEVKKKK